MRRMQVKGGPIRPAFRGPFGSGFMGGGSSTPPPVVDFGALLDTLCGAGTTVGYYRGDLGLHTTGPIVNQWDNQITTGAGRFGNCVEVTPGAGLANTTVLNGKAGVIANGTTQQGKITTVPQPLVAPAMSPLSAYAVMISPAPPLANAIFLGVSFNYALLQLPSSTTFEQYNGAAQTTALVTAAWGRTWASFTGTAADAIKWGAGPVVTGTNTGNNAGGSAPLGLFGDGTAAFGFSADGLVLLLLSRAVPATFAAAMPTLDIAVAAFYTGVTPILF